MKMIICSLLVLALSSISSARDLDARETVNRETAKLIIDSSRIKIHIPYIELDLPSDGTKLYKKAFKLDLIAPVTTGDPVFGVDWSSFEELPVEEISLEDGTGDDAFSPDVDPITGGGWYRPDLSSTWQWQLQGQLNTSYPVDIYDVDLVDTDAAVIEQLKKAGKKVICYFSAGSVENYRPDSDQFQPEESGNLLDGWPDEKWLDIRSTNVHHIMKARLDLAKEKGCDGVEPDNMDGYINDTGFDLTVTDQLAFNRFIANEAHKRDLAVGLKNDLDQISELVDYFDFAVNEQCFEHSECETLLPFIKNDKPVFNAEYRQEYVDNASSRETLCRESLELGFQTLILPLDLNDAFRFDCP